MNGYNFTEKVRIVLANAREEAGRLHHEYVGTEHILLALTRAEEETVALAVLRNLAIDLESIRRKVNEGVKTGKAVRLDRNELPYTSRSKKVLELAMSEARELGHSYVGTEHLLLGLIREKKGIGAQVLTYHGITLEAARAEALRLTDVVARAGELNSPGGNERHENAVHGESIGGYRERRFVKTFVFWMLLMLIPILLIQFSR